MTDTTPELDGLIARHIGVKTPREIAELAGCSAHEVIRRAEELKDEHDAITLESKIHFLLVRLDQIARSAQDAADNAPNARDASGLYAAATGAITQSLKQLATLKKENDGAVAELNRKRVQELLRLFTLVVERGVSDLAEEHDLDKMELLSTFQGHIVGAARELER